MGYSKQTDTNTAVGGHSVTPSDSALVTPMARALWIGQAGDVRVEGPDKTVITYQNVPVGQFNVQAVKVYATGTTAALIVAMH